MKLNRRLITGCVLALTMTATAVPTFAATGSTTPAEAAAAVTGKTVAQVTAQRQAGTSYGQIAAGAGNLTEFKKESLEAKKNNLNAQVAAGTITKERADEIIKAIEAAQANCDGTGGDKIGQKMGAKFGSNGTGKGTGGVDGLGKGTGAGKGLSGGKGLQGSQRGTGVCVVNPTN